MPNKKSLKYYLNYEYTFLIEKLDNNEDFFYIIRTEELNKDVFYGTGNTEEEAKKEFYEVLKEIIPYYIKKNILIIKE